MWFRPTGNSTTEQPYNPNFQQKQTDSFNSEPREGWQRKARSATRTCSAQPDPQGHAKK